MRIHTLPATHRRADRAGQAEAGEITYGQLRASAPPGM